MCGVFDVSSVYLRVAVLEAHHVRNLYITHNALLTKVRNGLAVHDGASIKTDVSVERNFHLSVFLLWLIPAWLGCAAPLRQWCYSATEGHHDHLLWLPGLIGTNGNVGIPVTRSM